MQTINLSHKHIMLMSLPVILANLTLPLQGMIDMAIIGQLNSAVLLNAVGLATQLFSLLFVSFNFLQYGSSGLSAQALGEGNTSRIRYILLRALLIAGGIALLLIALQLVWLRAGMAFYAVDSDTAEIVGQYYFIRIWGAWPELANLALIGWFAGQGQAKRLMRQQILISVLNVIANLILVLGFDLGIVGVAIGTVLANTIGVAVGLMMAKTRLHELGESFLNIEMKRLFNADELTRLMALNRDFFIRTVLLLLCFSWITRLGVQQGEITLAANLLLIQLFYLVSNGLDGVAVTTESFVGRAKGQKNSILLHDSVLATTRVSLMLALLLSLLMAVIMTPYLAFMTDIESVKIVAKQYQWWAIGVPIAGVLAFQFDGVFVGLTTNTLIRQAIIWVALIFFPVSFGLEQLFDNTGVWMSVYLLLILRGIILIRYYQKLNLVRA